MVVVALLAELVEAEALGSGFAAACIRPYRKVCATHARRDLKNMLLVVLS